MVDQEWNGSKISWYECRRCGNTFNCYDVHDVDDEGPWCFEGEHTTDRALVKCEGWDDDDDDDDCDEDEDDADDDDDTTAILSAIK